MKTQNKKKELSKTEQLSYEYARLKPFLAHAYLLNQKELKILESKTDIEDKVGFLQRVLFMDRGITHAFSDFVYDEPQDAGKKLLKELMNPDNFPYTCKLLFNIDLMPFQHVILKELWIRPFPMLVANRGAGKSWLLGLYTMLRLLFTQGCKVAIVGGSFRQAKGIFEYMEKFWYGGDIYRDIIGTSISSGGKQQGPRHSPERWDMTVGDSMAIALPLGDGCLSPLTPITYVNGFGTISEHASTIANSIVKRRRNVWGNGKFRLSDEVYNNGIKDTKKIITKRGYYFEGTHNHRMKVVENDKIVWKRADEMMVGDRILIDRSQRWHKGTIIATEDECYALGAMIGNGCWTNKHRIGFSTQDEYVINRLKKTYNFKQQSDKVHWNYYGINNVLDWLDKWDLDVSYALNKILPHTILSAQQNLMTACLQGLFDTDGGVQVAKDKRGGYSVSVSFWSVSEKLIDQIHYILLHYGIISTKDSRKRDNENWNKEFSIRITGKDVKLFAKKIGFGSPKKQNVLLNGINKQSKNISQGDTIPINLDKFIEYADCTWKESKKDDRVQARQLAKLKNITNDKLYQYLDNYPSNDYTISLQNLLDDNIYYDEITSIVNSECDTYDIHVPEDHEYCAGGFFSHNTKIRGQRANYLLADELASINEQIFNDTVFGFAAVSSAPVDKVVDIGSVNLLKAAGMWSNELQREIDKKHKGNQVVLSGTADYTFGHFYKTYKLYKSVIQCGNDENKLKEQLGEKFNTGLCAEDCVVVRLPATLLPEGFMDKKIIAVARAKLPAEVFQKEYDATFPNDSAGFYKMSLLLACTCPIKTQDDEIMFEPLLYGSPNYKYVLAIDPASEQDKLAITIIECRHNHRRLVYCWSTKKSQHNQLIAKGLVKEHDYFRYAADKIRELMTHFNIVEIACDAGGGGYAIREALGSPRSENQLPIYELKDPPDTKQPKMTDEMQGLHILNMIQFSNAKWVSDANYGLKLDFEQKTLIFPFYDLVSEEISLMEDKQQGRVVYNEKTGEEVRLYDSIISNHEEIQELKKELASISHSKTAANRERWDLPKHKGPDGKLITETKDRYSSLLMCNAVARLITANDLLPPKQETKIFGGKASEFVAFKRMESESMYLGQPSWIKDVSGWGVVKK